MKKLFRLLMFFWLVLAMMLINTDMFSYYHIFDNTDDFQLINRNYCVWFVHLILYPPLFFCTIYIIKNRSK